MGVWLVWDQEEREAVPAAPRAPDIGPASGRGWDRQSVGVGVGGLGVVEPKRGGAGPLGGGGGRRPGRRKSKGADPSGSGQGAQWGMAAHTRDTGVES